MPMGPFAQLLVVVSTTRAFLSRVEPGRILAPVDPNGVGGFESVAVNPYMVRENEPQTVGKFAID